MPAGPLPNPQYIEVRAHGRLLFKFDPGRDVVEIRQQGETVYVDLAQLRNNPPDSGPVAQEQQNMLNCT